MQHVKPFIIPFQVVVHRLAFFFFFFGGGVTASLVLLCLQASKVIYTIYNVCSGNGLNGVFQC